MNGPRQEPKVCTSTIVRSKWLCNFLIFKLGETMRCDIISKFPLFRFNIFKLGLDSHLRYSTRTARQKQTLVHSFYLSSWIGKYKKCDGHNASITGSHFKFARWKVQARAFWFIESLQCLSCTAWNKAGSRRRNLSCQQRPRQQQATNSQTLTNMWPSWE